MSTIKMKEFSDAVLDVCKSYYADVDDLRAQLAACAAGPWRFDVDNAPRDGSEVLLAWVNNGRVYTETLCWNETDEVWCNEDEGVLIIPPFAFATINPPVMP